MPSDPVLSARGLRRLLVGPLDLDVAPNESVCITGPSGSGKTLLLRALADLDPHDGAVLLDGVEQRAVPAPQWRRKVALLGAESRWWAPRVGDHFPSGTLGPVADVGFGAEVAGWDIERLSSGERQRLALLRVLALDPRVLLLDEPTANLDDDNAARVERLIEQWRRGDGRGVIWVSHDRGQVRRVCDRHLELDDGRWKPAA